MKYGLLLASHIIEEWRQYYIQYNRLKRTIDSLVLQVYGGDDASVSSGGSTTRYSRCNTLIKVFLYCFMCCIRSPTRDEDVIQAHSERKRKPAFLKVHTPDTPRSTRSYSAFSRSQTPPPRSKHYASLKSPFTLHHSAKETMANAVREEKQSLIDHAYSPPIASYSPHLNLKVNVGLTVNLTMDEHDRGDIYIDSKTLATQKWTRIIYKESDKVNRFYLNIEHQLLAEYDQILSKLDKLYKLLNIGSDELSDPSPQSKSEDMALKSGNQIRFLEPLKLHKKSKEKRNIHLYQMKLNIFILYQRFIALSNFRTLNQIGFRKILKKFDKNLKTYEQKTLMKEINEMEFVESVECSQCMNDLIAAYSNLFEGGDFHKAKVKLLDSMSWSKWSTRSAFTVGLKMGVLIGLIGWSVSALSVEFKEKRLPQNAIYAYRSIGCFLAFLWFWSADVYIWSKYRINYVFIFEFEPRTRLTFLQYFDEAATLSLIYFINAVLFLKSTYWIPDKYVTIWPTALLIFFILRLFLPIFDHWKSRQCLIDATLQTVIAPFGRVRFRDFFMGDVMTSLVKVFADLYISICVLSLNEYFEDENDSFCVSSTFTQTVKPICICAPYWFRFAQCLNRYFHTHDRVPHLPNAVKYGTAMSVTLLGTLHSSYATISGMSSWSPGRILWLGSTVISTCYLIFWDLQMDWALFKPKRLKEYPKWWYIVALCLDIILRYLWTFTLFPTSANPYFHHGFSFLNAAGFMAFIEVAELFRRAVWAIFRVEIAHVSRKDEFRSYEYVPLFYEHTSLIDQQTKANKPASMLLETCSLFLLVVVITIVIVLTQ